MRIDDNSAKDLVCSAGIRITASTQVESRKANFESQINLIWTDFGTLPKQIGEEAAMYRRNTPLASQNDDDLLRAIAPYLVELLKKTKTTGAFLILPKGDKITSMNDEPQETLYSSLYIRNLDPNQKGQDSYNLKLDVNGEFLYHWSKPFVLHGESEQVISCYCKRKLAWQGAQSKGAIVTQYKK